MSFGHFASLQWLAPDITYSASCLFFLKSCGGVASSKETPLRERKTEGVREGRWEKEREGVGEGSSEIDWEGVRGEDEAREREKEGG